MQHVEDINVAMGNIEKIWGAMLDQTLALQTNQATDKGEFVAVINVLCRQMESVHQDLEEADSCLDHHQADLVKHSSWIHQAQQSSNFVGDQVTVLEGDWGHGKLSKFKALLERMDHQETLIQDL